MNLVDCYVTKVTSKPIFEKCSGCWGISVKFNSYGIESETQLFFDTQEEALKIKKGYKFLS